MPQKARVEYDFAGIRENGEINLSEGDIVNVLKTDVGDGWWEGLSERTGETGLFPEAYVTLLNDQSNSIVTPTQDYSANTMETPHWEENDYQTNNSQRYQNDDNDDAWSEDWDDGQSDISTIQQNHSATHHRLTNDVQTDSHSVNSIEGRPARVGTISKNFNRFSSFVKHGGEAFVLGKADAKVRQVDQVHIVPSNDGTVCWKKNEHSFTCTIEKPQIQSKMKGLKSFVAYKITPSDTDVSVQRRYKHFDWLYDRLVQRYPMLVVPKLPEKQASGRFEEDFIESRMSRLKLWVDHICRHPILSTSSVFRNYITLTEQKAWKMAKRKAERDELLGANFFLTIDVFSQPNAFDVRDAEMRLDQFKKFARAMDDGISQLNSSSRDFANKSFSVFKKEFITMSRSFNSIASAFNQHQTPPSQALTDAVRQTGNTYEKIGEMYGQQPKYDMTPLLHHLWLYKGVLDVFPDIWHTQSGALRKVRECKKLQEEGRMSSADVDAVEERTLRISSCMQAEVSHFHEERVTDFKLMMTDMLRSQIEFYEGIAGELKVALRKFEEIPDS